jgi:membrane-bound lytic murein transglycosylase MltF
VIWVGLLIFGAAFAALKKNEIVEVVEVHMDSWNRFDQEFRRYAPASIAGVPGWQVLKAIALNESDLGREKSVAHGIQFPLDVEKSKSYDGLSWGLMQVTLRTARELDAAATEAKLNDPSYSIRLASQYFSKLVTYFNPLEPRYLEWVIKSYNQGPGNSRKERAGTGGGYANEYWARFQRNLKRVQENP